MRFGDYDGYCYLPLYIFCGEHLLCAKLRRANIDGAAGAREEVERIVSQIRQRWSAVKIILRPRRMREPHQGSAARSVCRSTLGRHVPGQSVAAVARLGRLRIGARAAPCRTGRDRARAGLREHHPAQASEDRRGRHGKRAARETRDERGLCEPERVHHGLPQSERRGARRAPRRDTASSLFHAPAPEIGDDFARGIVAGCAGHTAARMRARSAHVQSFQRSAIVAVSEHWPRREHLVQAQGAVKNVAADQSEGSFEIERAHDLPS
jgi:hypothetical protein